MRGTPESYCYPEVGYFMFELINMPVRVAFKIDLVSGYMSWIMLGCADSEVFDLGKVTEREHLL